MVQRKFQDFLMPSLIQKKKKKKNLWKNCLDGGRVMLATRKRKCVTCTRALMMCWNKVKWAAVSGKNTGRSTVKYC
jgi:hypothetical protein